MDCKMKRFLSLALIVVLMLTLALTSCGKKEVKDIRFTEGFKYEYEIGETPDFSGVKATIVYNDETTKEVDASDPELKFGSLDTSTSGKKTLEVSYGKFTTTFQVTVKSKSISSDSKELVSIKYLSGISENVYVGDNINFGNVTILATYSDGSTETKTVSSSSAIKHNGAEITTDVAGSKTLKITFMNKTCEYVINVQEIVVVRLDVISANLNVTEGMEFDKTSLRVNKVFNNGGIIEASLSELTVTQDGNIITIALGSVSTTLDLNIQDPVVTSMILNTANLKNKVLVGDTINTAAITITGNLNNGLTESISLSDVTFGAVDTTVAGTKTVTVTYNKDTAITASFEVTVLDIKSVAIDASTIEVSIPAGTEFKYNDLKVLIIASDDSTFIKGIADGVTVDASNVDINSYGQYKITATYMGVTSAEQNVTVHDPDISYTILGVALPESITAQTTYQNDFIVKEQTYVVGDDNPFTLKLTLTIINSNNEIVDDYDSYKSYFEVWKDGKELTEAEYAEFVEAINAENNSIDFTQAAVGQTFTIKTRPADGIDESDYSSMTRELTVKIVDAINIHEAWELNYLVNYDDLDYAEISQAYYPNSDHKQTTVVDAFLAGKGVTRPANMAGAVLHDNLVVTPADIPSEYFHESGNLFDFITIFPHATDKDYKTFTFYGNYFTIFSYELPEVCEKGQGNNGDMVSSGSLFRFTCKELNATDFNLNDYTTRLENIYFRDNNPNSNNEANERRAIRGIIGMKVQFHKIEAENIRIEAFYINFFLDNDYTVASVNNCIFYNAHQNHIYSYNENHLGADDTAPAANHSPITLSITNSKITKSGGPVILNQTEAPHLAKNSKSGAQVTIDENTEIWTWVTGTEAWFKAIGAETVASQLSGLGLLLAQSGMPKTFASMTGENGMTGPNGEIFMNMVMVNIVSGGDFNDVINFKGDLDGSFTKGDVTYLDMNDSVALDGVHGYGSQTVATEFITQAMAGKEPIIINTHTDGAIIVDKNSQTATPAGNVTGLADGDLVAIYYGCFGFVFGYAPFQQ